MPSGDEVARIATANVVETAATDRSVAIGSRHAVARQGCRSSCSEGVRMVGKSMPTEVEWEFAARSGLPGATFVWGEVFAPNGKMVANTWQGEFPWQNLLNAGSIGTSPVKSSRQTATACTKWPATFGNGRATASGRSRPNTLVACLGTPRATLARGKSGPRSGGRPHPMLGDQGRLAPMRTRLLPALPARGPSERGGRNVNGPYRFPLRRPMTPRPVRTS
jgi:Sulfatase-modifying factor enzyme 1